MDKNQRENRRKAEEKFKRALDELEAALGSQSPQAETPAAAAEASSVTPDAAEPEDREALIPGSEDWERALAEAAHDIEQFMSEYPSFPPPDQDEDA